MRGRRERGRGGEGGGEGRRGAKASGGERRGLPAAPTESVAPAHALPPRSWRVQATGFYMEVQCQMILEDGKKRNDRA